MSLRLLDGLLSLSNHKTGALEGHSFKRNLILPLRLRSRRRRGRGQVSTLASLSTSASASASASPSLGDLMRLDFPILNQEVNGSRLVYLDNAATSQKPHFVIDAVRKYYEVYNANVHRGIHFLSEKATSEYELARRKVANFINASSSEEIVFTRNATEAINLVAYSWGLTNMKEGDEILMSIAEHHSAIVPWQFVAEKTGAVLKFVEFKSRGSPRSRTIKATYMQEDKTCGHTSSF